MIRDTDVNEFRHDANSSAEALFDRNLVSATSPRKPWSHKRFQLLGVFQDKRYISPPPLFKNRNWPRQDPRHFPPKPVDYEHVI